MEIMLLPILFPLSICFSSTEFIVDYDSHGILPNTSTLVLGKGLLWLGQGEFSSVHAQGYNYLLLDNETILNHFNKDISRYIVANKTQAYFVERDIEISPPLICLSDYRCKFGAFWTLESGWIPRNLTLETDSPDSVTLAASTTTLNYEATVTGPSHHIIWFKPISWYIEATFQKSILVRRYPEYRYSTESKIIRISQNSQKSIDGFFGIKLANK